MDKKSLFSFFSIVAVAALIHTLVSTAVADARAADSMTPDQIERVKKGEQVYVTEKIPGSKWSKVTIYQTIDSTPEEAAAVTMDWGLKHTYTNGLLKSEVEQPSAFDGADALVDYTVKVPLIGSEDFTLENKMLTNDNGQTYETSFVLKRADRTRASEGVTQFEPFNGVTLMKVVSHTDPPNIPFIGAAENTALKQTLDTCNAFVKQVGVEKASNPALLQKQIQLLQSGVAQLRAATTTP